MKLLRNLLAVTAVAVLLTGSSYGQSIVLVNEDFSTGPGLVVGGNAGAGFAASGGVGTLTGNGTDTFISVGVENIMIPQLALGGQLTFNVDNLGTVANPVTRWLQVNVDNANTFMGRMFGSTDTALLLNHADDSMTNVGTTTIPVGTTELDLLYVTTVDFGGTALPVAEIARLGSFSASFVPNAAAIPEPSSTSLLALGLVSVLGVRRRKS